MKTIGKRIMVIGSPGSGKSTFSRQLANITELPLIHLDKEFWNYGWIETPREEWIRKQEKLVAGEQWIIDGNYGSTMDIRLKKADTIICFNLNRMICIMSYFKRVMTNLNKVRLDMPEGCPENFFDIEFMKYIWEFPNASGQKNFKKLNEYKNKRIIVFKNRCEAKKFIEEYKR